MELLLEEKFSLDAEGKSFGELGFLHPVKPTMASAKASSEVANAAFIALSSSQLHCCVYRKQNRALVNLVTS